jgi:hypothetical protein
MPRLFFLGISDTTATLQYHGCTNTFALIIISNIQTIVKLLTGSINFDTAVLQPDRGL